MAHSIAGASASEINYFYQDEHGKVVKVMKPAQIKAETLAGGTTFGYNNHMSTSNHEDFIRIPNDYDMKANSQYTAIAGQDDVGGMQHQSGATHKYETNAIKNEERYVKYPPQNSITKAKVKLHNNHNNAATNHNTNATATSAAPHPSSSSNHHHHAYKVQKKRKPEKAGKGLRHFSMKVCEKVKEKGATTYNEVADELVAEEIQTHSLDSANCDQKNIRRRVYDALNVLMAMQIISKDKKEIRWIGLPSTKHETQCISICDRLTSVMINQLENSFQECADIETRIDEQRENIERKHQQLRELLLQYVSFKGLVERNKQAERQGIVPTNNSSIQLPFIIVNTHKSTKINCSVTNDKSEYIFKFDDKFEMHDDAEVLKHMGLLAGLDKGQCSYEDIERFKMLVPPNFVKYIEGAYGNGKGVVSCDSDDEMPSYIDNDTQDYNSMHADGSKSPDLDDKEFLTNSDID